MAFRGIVSRESEVPKGIEDCAPAMYLDALRYVRMVTENQVRARIDRMAPQFDLVFGELLVAGRDTPMEGADDDIGLLACGGNVRAQLRLMLRCDPRMDDRRRTRRFEVAGRRLIRRVRAHHREPGRLRPGFPAFHEDRCIAEQRHLAALALDDRRRVRCGEVAPAAGMPDADAVEIRQRLEQRLLAVIHHVIVGDRHRIESCGFDRSDLPCIGFPCDRAGLLADLAAVGDRAFEVAQSKIGCAQQLLHVLKYARRVVAAHEHIAHDEHRHFPVPGHRSLRYRSDCVSSCAKLGRYGTSASVKVRTYAIIIHRLQRSGYTAWQECATKRRPERES